MLILSNYKMSSAFDYTHDWTLVRCFIWERKAGHEKETSCDTFLTSLAVDVVTATIAVWGIELLLEIKIDMTFHIDIGGGHIEIESF
jgi:hypothetical protein